MAVLSIQIPLGILVLIQRVSEPYLEQSPVLAVLLLVPLFSVGSSLCSALTLGLIEEIPNKSTLPSLSAALNKVLNRFKRLLLSSLVVSLFFGLGLAAFMIPGIYFMALYLFVPLIVLTEPEQPILSYLYHSKILVKQSRKVLLTTLTIVSLSMVIELATTVLVEFISKIMGGALLIDLFLTMSFGALLDCFIVFYFHSLRAKGNP